MASSKILKNRKKKKPGLLEEKAQRPEISFFEDIISYPYLGPILFLKKGVRNSKKKFKIKKKINLNLYLKLKIKN
jgi:hypothetical protein